jgi:four helix bundle protein
MTEGIRSFKDLLVWQRALQLAKHVYNLTRSFPPDERFGLTSQLRRAAVSVSSNIAEGHARQGREYAYFLSITRGSLAEIESQLLLAVELGYMRVEQVQEMDDLITDIRKMCIAIGKKLSSSAHPSPLTPRPSS